MVTRMAVQRQVLLREVLNLDVSCELGSPVKVGVVIVGLRGGGGGMGGEWCWEVCRSDDSEAGRR